MANPRSNSDHSCMLRIVTRRNNIQRPIKTTITNSRQNRRLALSIRSMSRYIASIDLGTSSTRVILYDDNGDSVSSHQVPVELITPKPGWVEQDPNLYIQSTHQCLDQAVKNARIEGFAIEADSIVGIGITNQRETTVLWDKETGQPLHNALVWLDNRTTEIVEKMIQDHGSQDHFREICGLPISTYFSALKIRWLIDNVPDVKEACENNRCMFGTVDSWVLWNLTGGTNGGIHVTDVSNASRTMLMNLESLCWDSTMIECFNIPESILPEIKSSAEIYGTYDGPVKSFQKVPLAGCLGDQQSALLGHVGINIGDVKNTYGTGCFMLYNTGETPIHSTNGLLTTVAFKFGENPVNYALEGSISVAGAGLTWLQENLQILESPKKIDEIIQSVGTSSGVYFVPAFSGLFAPYWRDDAKAAILGLTQHSTKENVIIALVEAICFRSKEIIDCMEQDSGKSITEFVVDGGLTNSRELLQIQANILGKSVRKPNDIETTARGAAYAAGIAVGLWDIDQLSTIEPSNTVTTSNLNEENRERMIRGWKKAVKSVLLFANDHSE
eukprot:TRINITY_DN3791_c0_g1_i1.p1 TRINITY_DN3791_c0_g1~~TRINITY_DN3791_c0_g1_i1.p1  ORF type:complete len:557 (-),score=90.58 TRINITY_DN3791_c0_g1_i1:25-1695(-)